MMPVLQTSSLGYRAGEPYLVRGVSLVAQAGQVLAVVGPNGAGKSTLLRLLSGELAASEGIILLNGRGIDSYSTAELARQRAVLPQQTVIEFAFKAREVVLMGRNPHIRGGWAGREDHEIAELEMTRTETTALAERSYPSLSGGEGSRVNLARVLAQRAPLLLLDEPTASLDLHHQEMVMQSARELAARGACVTLILHDLNLAAAYADRVVMLHRGEAIAAGAPEDVFREELLSDVFGCSIRVVRDAALPHPIVMPDRSGVRCRDAAGRDQ